MRGLQLLNSTGRVVTVLSVQLAAATLSLGPVTEDVRNLVTTLVGDREKCRTNGDKLST